MGVILQQPSLLTPHPHFSAGLDRRFVQSFMPVDLLCPIPYPTCPCVTCWIPHSPWEDPLYSLEKKTNPWFLKGEGVSPRAANILKYENAAKASKLSHPGAPSRNLTGNTPGLAVGCKWGLLASPGCVTLHHMSRHSWVAPHNVMTLHQVLGGTWVAPHPVCCHSEQGAI